MTIQHHRNDSGFEDDFLIELSKKIEEAKKPERKKCCNLSKRSMCGIFVIAAVIMIIVLVTSVIASSSGQLLDPDTSSIVPENTPPQTDATDIFNSRVVWPTLIQPIMLYTFLRKGTLIRWDSKLSFPVLQQGAGQTSFKTNTQTKSLYYIDTSSTIMQWDANTESAFSLNIKATSILQATTSGVVYAYERTVRIMNATGDYLLFDDIIPPSHSFYNASSQNLYLVIGDSQVAEKAVDGQTRKMVEHDSKINALVAKRNYVYICYDDGLIYEWSVSEWKQTRVFNAITRVRDIAVNEELNVLYIYTVDGMVKEWDLSERNVPVVLFSLGRDHQESHILSYCSNAKVLVIRRDRRAEFWDTVERRIILELKVSTITEGTLEAV